MNKLISKILIIDDNTANILLLKRMLSISGYHDVKSLTDSRQTLEICKSYKPDLILLDFIMPFMNGLEVIDSLNSDKNCNHFPIIIISAENETKYYNEALSKGAVDFIMKPFSYTEIISKIEKVFLNCLNCEA